MCALECPSDPAMTSANEERRMVPGGTTPPSRVEWWPASSGSFSLAQCISSSSLVFFVPGSRCTSCGVGWGRSQGVEWHRSPRDLGVDDTRRWEGPTEKHARTLRSAIYAPSKKTLTDKRTLSSPGRGCKEYAIVEDRAQASWLCVSCTARR
ncbi:hypothetical protein DFH09DRAFT_75363 [Mycena vulgaris]|nr:hypothetical protein DFH09DRAFT_75363 [Mycena vulgaris]